MNFTELFGSHLIFIHVNFQMRTQSGVLGETLVANVAFVWTFVIMLPHMIREVVL